MGVFGTLGSVVGGPLGGAIGGAADAGIGHAAGNAQNKKQAALNFKYWRKQYDIQRADNLADYYRQRSDYLDDLFKSKLRERQSLQNAGYSTAMTENQGFSPNAAQQVVNQANPSGVSSGDVSSAVSGMFTSGSAANEQLILAQVEKTKAETAKLQTDTKRAQEEFSNWQTTTKQLLNDQLANTVKLLEQDVSLGYYRRDYEGKYYEEKAARISEIVRNEVEQLKLGVDKMSFDLSKAKEFKQAEFDKLKADTFAAIENGNLAHEKAEQTKIIERFNAMGIGIDGSIIGSIAALLTSGNGDKLASSAVSTCTKFFESLFTTISDKISPFGK